MTTPAPFHHDIALGLDTAKAVWIQAQDGVRLRIGIWNEGDKGTVLLFPGRTEYIEKYGLAAEDLAKRGYATVAIDWRGQGLSDRLLDNPLTGHVGRYSDYQLDVAAMLDVARAQGLPAPFYLLAHSMGGAIGLRSLMEELPVKAAVFTAPMWGIEMASHLRPAAWAMSWGARNLRLGHLLTPGTRADSYVGVEPFADNDLTSDRDMYEYMRTQIMAQPGFALAGPSLQWLYESLKELRSLAAEPAPLIPTLTFLGSAENIVQPRPIHMRMNNWPKGRLEIVRGARHEVMMEIPAIRTQVFDQIAKHFSATA